MGLFSQFSNFKHSSFSSATQQSRGGTPKTVATAQSDGADAYKRIERKSLETLYLTDPQTFNTINTYKQLLLQTGYKIVAYNKTNQIQYDKFFNNIGLVGMQMGTEQLVDRIINDTCLYGYAYIEKVFNGGIIGNKIIDLKPVDAKLMDYARNNDNMILINQYQNPIGYTMKIGYSVKAVSDPLPEGIRMNSDQIFLKAERIACFTLFPYGNGFESIGIVEPAYEETTRKKKLITAVANSIYNTAQYPIYAVVGDAQRSASKQLMEGTLNALQNFSYNRYGVFSYPTQLNTLQVAHSPQADEFLRFLRTEQSAASGLALGFTVGTGEAVNRSTLGTQKEMMDVKLDSLSWSIAEQFTKKILDPLFEYNKYGSKAKMIWNEISTEDKIDKAKILMDAIDRNAILPIEARRYILQSNDLDGDEEEYKKEMKKKERQEKQQNIQTKQMINKKKEIEDSEEEE